MKKKEIELDVDFIGGQEALTPAEEKALSEFFKQRKKTSFKQLNLHQSKKSKQSKQLKQLPNSIA